MLFIYLLGLPRGVVVILKITRTGKLGEIDPLQADVSDAFAFRELVHKILR